jgi:hypothetical protein
MSYRTPPKPKPNTDGTDFRRLIRDYVSSPSTNQKNLIADFIALKTDYKLPNAIKPNFSISNPEKSYAVKCIINSYLSNSKKQSAMDKEYFESKTKATPFYIRDAHAFAYCDCRTLIPITPDEYETRMRAALAKIDPKD